MAQLIRWLRAEAYKVTHSSMLWIHLLIPIFGMAVMLAYYGVSLREEVRMVSAYLQLLAMAFPIMIGIITAMTAEREGRAGSFQMFLSAPCRRYIPHAASLITLLVLGLFASLIAVFGFGICFHQMGYSGFSQGFYLKATMLLFVGNIPVYLLQYLVGFLLGKGACLGIGIVGSLLSALLLTGLGEGIWWFLPWGLSIRFVSGAAAYQDKLFSAFPQMWNGIYFLVAACVLLFLAIVCFAGKWEGRKNEED